MAGENTVYVLNALIKELNIPLSEGAIKAELDKHPEHYSFLGLSDVLTTWRIPNGVFELPFDQLEQIPLPFVAHLSSNKGEFVLVTGFTKEGLIISNEVYSSKRSTTGEFKALYTGKVLAAEKEATSGEENYRLKKRRELRDALRYPAVLTGVGIIIACFILSDHAWRQPLLFCSMLCKLAGGIISLMLALKSVNIDNPLIQKLCFTSPKSDCNAVVYSRYAQITDELSWAEAGMFYFFFGFLGLLFGINHEGVVAALAFFSLPAVLYTVYSVIYQGFVIKQWCILCLAVQVLLWLDAACLYPTVREPFTGLLATHVYRLLACALIPVVLWMFIKPLLKRSGMLNTFKEQLREFKGRNIHLFRRLMDEQPLHNLPDDSATIMEGNPEAPTRLTLISKPYCEACADVHNEIGNWLSTRDDLQLQLVYYVLNYDGDPETEMATHLMRLYQDGDTDKFNEAINAWHNLENKNFARWAARYPAGNTTDVSGLLEAQRLWCNDHEVHTTPLLLINGRALPALYKPADIKYFI